MTPEKTIHPNILASTQDLCIEALLHNFESKGFGRMLFTLAYFRLCDGVLHHNAIALLRIWTDELTEYPPRSYLLQDSK